MLYQLSYLGKSEERQGERAAVGGEGLEPPTPAV
jgi:hypothetical protein